MNLHANAKTCPNSRELLASRVIELDRSYSDAAEASKRTVAKWVPSGACACRNSFGSAAAEQLRLLSGELLVGQDALLVELS
jgi:hypothetical protein